MNAVEPLAMFWPFTNSCAFCRRLLREDEACEACAMPSLGGSLELPEPTWMICACGERYMGARCWNCAELAAKRAAAAKRVAAGEATIPETYRWARFGATSPRLVASEGYQELARRAVDAPTVILIGPAGAGKTTLVVAMMRAWMAKHGLSALFAPAYRLGQARIQHRAGDGEAKLVEEAMRAPLLVLDDLGIERQSAVNAVPDVILDRHAAAAPLWVTTGLGMTQKEALEAISSLYGDGFARRLFERARCIALPLPGTSERLERPARAPAHPSYDPVMRRAGDDA